MRVFFEVSFDLPSGSTKSAARDYVLSAVTAECGSLHPDEPIFDLDRSSISVKGIRMTTKAELS